MKKITDILPEEWLHMDGFDEEYAQKWFEGFMANRGIKSLSELKDYIIYLEDIKLFTYHHEPLDENDVIAESDVDIYELLGKQNP